MHERRVIYHLVLLLTGFALVRWIYHAYKGPKVQAANQTAQTQGTANPTGFDINRLAPENVVSPQLWQYVIDWYGTPTTITNYDPPPDFVPRFTAAGGKVISSKMA